MITPGSAEAAVLGRLWGALNREAVPGIGAPARDGGDAVLRLADGRELRGDAAAAQPFAVVAAEDFAVTLDGAPVRRAGALVRALRPGGHADRLAAELDDSAANLAAARAAQPPPDGGHAYLSRAVSLVDLEQCVVDGHPLHPLCRTRMGMNADEVRRYGPEYRPTVQLAVLAVPEQRWHSTGAGLPPRLPVHPWQYEHVLDAVPVPAPHRGAPRRQPADVAAYPGSARHPERPPEDRAGRADDLGGADRLAGRRAQRAAGVRAAAAGVPAGRDRRAGRGGGRRGAGRRRTVPQPRGGVPARATAGRRRAGAPVGGAGRPLPRRPAGHCSPSCPTRWARRPTWCTCWSRRCCGCWAGASRWRRTGRTPWSCSPRAGRYGCCTATSAASGCTPAGCARPGVSTPGAAAVTCAPMTSRSCGRRLSRRAISTVCAELAATLHRELGVEPARLWAQVAAAARRVPGLASDALFASTSAGQGVGPDATVRPADRRPVDHHAQPGRRGLTRPGPPEERR